jgi:YbbR domain-containing protein
MRAPSFLRNLPLKLAALALAVVLWAAAQGFRSVEESLDLPISLQAVPGELVVVGQSAREVNLRLRGSRAALRRATKELVRYSVNLDGAQPPEYRHAISADALPLPRGSRVVFRSPSSVTVKLEPRAQKRVPVKADLGGSPPAGYRVDKVVLDPAEVTLEGAGNELRRIRQVLTDRIDLGEMRSSFEQEVRLVLDANHVWRADDRERVRVRVEIVAPVEAPPPAAPPAGGQGGG